MFHEDERALAQGPPKRERQSHGGPLAFSPFAGFLLKNCSGAGRGALTATVAASWHLSIFFGPLDERAERRVINENLPLRFARGRTTLNNGDKCR